MWLDNHCIGAKIWKCPDEVIYQYAYLAHGVLVILEGVGVELLGIELKSKG